MNQRTATFGLIMASVVVLAIGWVLDVHRIWEGPVELVVAPGYGLHRMDVVIISLALVPWIGILAGAVWPKRRR